MSIAYSGLLSRRMLLSATLTAAWCRGQRAAKAVPAPPPPAPLDWLPLLGEYGGDKTELVVLERNGHLTALHPGQKPPEFMALTSLGGDQWSLRARPQVRDETLAFIRDDGRVAGVRRAGVVLPRRALGPESGAVFRIQPLRPVSDLRREALAAQPPVERGPFRPPELIDLRSLDPTIRLDIRYATSDNFLSTPVYTTARALMQRPAAEALARSHRALARHGYGLLIHDAYRPWHVTKIFWEATPVAQREFVANPAQGSRHNRGCAVDLTLYERATGKAVEMVGVYDEMSPRSYPDYPGGTSRQRWHRDLLRAAMEAERFTVFPQEWWHFDYRDWREYGIQNVPLEAIR